MHSLFFLLDFKLCLFIVWDNLNGLLRRDHYKLLRLNKFLLSRQRELRDLICNLIDNVLSGEERRSVGCLRAYNQQGPLALDSYLTLKSPSE
jgi:hypothetical protein